MVMCENDKIRAYANEMPAELRRVIAALDDDIGLAILFVLFKYGATTLSQIMDKLDIIVKDNSELRTHIKTLEKSSLVQSEYVKRKGEEVHTFYDITEFGERIIFNLMDTLRK